MRRGEVITVMGVGETKGWAGEGVMMWASVGRAAARERRRREERKEGSGKGEED